MRVIRYQCTLRTGWKMWGRTGWAEPTGRAKDFLPCVIDFLSQKPDFRAPICAVLQVRLFNFDRVEKLGTLIVLQELPSGITDDGTKEPRLVIAARFSLENWDENRKNKEIEALGLLLGIRASPKSDTLREELERKNWNYDLILRIYVLNEILSDSSLKNTNLTGANVSTKLIASFYPLAPREESLKISNFPLWLPDSSEEEDGVLNYTYCLPWLALKERLSSQDSSVIYLIPRAENMDKLKEISDDIWQNNKAKNIVLAAPYGSGKEVLAQVIHYGRSRGNMVSTSVAGVEWRDWEIMLLGQGQPSGPPILPGYIDQAKGGTLFIDEIDKAKANLRGGLLRVIEADEFRRPGGIEIVRLTSENRPLIVFAGSGSGDAYDKWKRKQENRNQDLNIFARMQKEPPPDFWDRRDKLINYSHPLQENGIYSNVLLSKFISLFMRIARDRVAEKESSPYSVSILLKISDAVIMQRLKRWWGNSRIRLCTKIDEIITRKLRTNANPMDSLPSLRRVRSAANYLVEKLRSRARETDDINSELNTIVSEACKVAFEGYCELAPKN